MLLVVAATEAELRGAPGAATLACGIGPVDAGIATAHALAERRPTALLHIGIAGCRRGCGMEPPQLVVGSESIYCDARDVGLIRARVEPSHALLDAARDALPEAPVLPIGTSARVDGTTGCVVEAMEGFAVLRAAELAGIPAIEIRAIANEIEESDRSRWRFDDALAALADALPPLIARLEECAS